MQFAGSHICRDFIINKIFEILGDEDDAYKYFVNIVLSQSSLNPEESKDDHVVSQEHAVRSYRAMTILKHDLSISAPSVLIKNPTQAGLLAKDLLLGLSSAEKRYSTFHIRELLDALLEAFPEKVMAAAAAGGKEGVQDHLGPLLTSDQTLSILTHLVCYGCTGRKGIASAEKSAQHTALYHHMQNTKSKISIGQRRKFVKAIADFQLLEGLANCLTNTIDSSKVSDVGEEVCETILTILEVVGYPPDTPGQSQLQAGSKTKEEVTVGEDVLLSPLGTPGWWNALLETLQSQNCTLEQREAIARTCAQVFSLATGNSSRICKSHAPATDATEQTIEEIVEEKEDKIINRLVEWGLTDKIHSALLTQLPLLIGVLNLPEQDILNHQATTSTSSPSENDEEESSTVLIRHPGRYKTAPLGSWRLQLLSLLKEIIVYKRGDNSSCASNRALDVVMQLPVPPEIQKVKKKLNEEEVKEAMVTSTPEIYNPWPALCSLIWAYPNNDFYHIVFFEMLQSVVMEHHEETLRLVLQKSKFLSRAVRSFPTAGPLQGILINCLNLLRLRAQSLPPSAFLPQYLGSHDGFKEHVDKLVEYVS